MILKWRLYYEKELDYMTYLDKIIQIIFGGLPI